VRQGADEVIDYTRHLRRDRFDVVFDAAGASSFAAARQVLTEGCYINTLGTGADGERSGAIVALRLPARGAVHLQRSGATWQLADLAPTACARIRQTVTLDQVADAARGKREPVAANRP
jgi:NADPH:quinone reductase-like Zn-dependent oxidoreductase